jgi:GNAT superfamily N-acetyltransferase
MSFISAPFSETSYRLPSCSLASLTENEAGFLSTRLAAIDPWLTLGYSAEGLSHYLLRPDPALYRFAVFVGPEAKGLVCVRYPWLRGPCLELLAVFNDQQRRGLGREIMSWMQAQCPRTAPNIWTLTSSFNSGARLFYRSLGFSEIVPLPDLTSSGSDEILLRKILE